MAKNKQQNEVIDALLQGLPEDAGFGGGDALDALYHLQRLNVDTTPLNEQRLLDLHERYVANGNRWHPVHNPDGMRNETDPVGPMENELYDPTSTNKELREWSLEYKSLVTRGVHSEIEAHMQKHPNMGSTAGLSRARTRMERNMAAREKQIAELSKDKSGTFSKKIQALRWKNGLDAARIERLGYSIADRQAEITGFPGQVLEQMQAYETDSQFIQDLTDGTADPTAMEGSGVYGGTPEHMDVSPAPSAPSGPRVREGSGVTGGTPEHMDLSPDPRGMEGHGVMGGTPESQDVSPPMDTRQFPSWNARQRTFEGPQIRFPSQRVTTTPAVGDEFNFNDPSHFSLSDALQQKMEADKSLIQGAEHAALRRHGGGPVQ